MIDWNAQRLAELAGARLVRRGPQSQPVPDSSQPGPSRAVIDSREAGPGDLFVGLQGSRADGGAHAHEALAAGAWGALVAPAHAESLAGGEGGAVLSHEDPLGALQSLARAWRDRLGERGCRVVAVTGSTGKTSTKDILAVLLSQRLRTIASSANLNTEIGLPLTILAAPPETEALVLEMAMRGRGQIAQLAGIARPEVGLITNVGPVHLELLGSLQAIAAAKAELIERLDPGATIVVPAAEPLLAPHLRADLRTITFGEGGDVRLLDGPRDDGLVLVEDASTPIGEGPRTLALRPSFAQAHNLRNLLAAVAAASALGVTPAGDLAVAFSPLRGERIALRGNVVLIDDCYNANPMSMRAAIDDLAVSAPGRRVAVLGDMLELGPDELPLHREVAEHARTRVDLLITVGPLAASMREPFLAQDPSREAHSVQDAHQAGELLARLLCEGDTVLVKGSRGVGLERVARALEHLRAVEV